MKECVIVVTGDVEHLGELLKVLASMPYKVAECESCSNLQILISDSGASAVILDLDSVPVDNRCLKRLKTENPRIPMLTVSSRKVHPELRESISSYILARLGIPIDAEELEFWLRSIMHDSHAKGPAP